MSEKESFEMSDIFGITPLEKEAAGVKNKENLPEFTDMDAYQQQKKLIKLFREVFGTHDGKIVLGIILEDLYYFRDCKNDEARALSNYAKTLLSQRLGFNDNSKRIEALFNAQ